VLLATSFALGLGLLPIDFAIGLGIYYSLTLSYSLFFKRWIIIDVITLAMLYTLRIIVGSVTFSIQPSFWLLAFSMFIFLSLAFLKRYIELFHLSAHNKKDEAGGRGYLPGDLQMIASLGTASGYGAIVILALYIRDIHSLQLYRHEQFIWIACPLILAWISRIWLLANRGLINEDPVIFAFKDVASYIVGTMIILVFWMAI